MNPKSSEDERASRPIMEDVASWWMKAFKPMGKAKNDKFEGFREPDYLDRRWEPEQL